MVIVLLTSLVYANSLPGAFHFDDFPLILENPLIQEDFPLTSFLDHYWGRPLTLFTFHWNHRIFGGEPLTYRLVSLLLHLLTVVLLSQLLWEISRKPSPGCGSQSFIRPASDSDTGRQLYLVSVRSTHDLSESNDPAIGQKATLVGLILFSSWLSGVG